MRAARAGGRGGGWIWCHCLYLSMFPFHFCYVGINITFCIQIHSSKFAKKHIGEIHTEDVACRRTKEWCTRSKCFYHHRGFSFELLKNLTTHSPPAPKQNPTLLIKPLLFSLASYSKRGHKEIRRKKNLEVKQHQLSTVLHLTNIMLDCSITHVY